MKWQAQAPANIALIKYMGKTVPSSNLPSNASLSYTLPQLQSFVELELVDEGHDQWQSLDNFELAPQGQARFLKHLTFLKEYFNCRNNFIIRSKNNFPADCGLASSASSYAALTRCTCLALEELLDLKIPLEEQVKLSRQASGSSCRSFFEPWALWQQESAEAIDLPFKNLHHQVIVVSNTKKAVSSTQAHQKVTSSLLFNDRPQRANTRLDQLITALTNKDWQQAYELCWQEFWDMHALFETSNPAFGYMNADSLRVLNFIRDYWQEHQDGPIVTMDAGPNIHLLYRQDQKILYFTKDNESEARP